MTSSRLRHRLLSILATLEAVYGSQRWRGPRQDPLDSLIATLLSQATSDRNSTRAFANLKTRFPTWQLARSAQPRSLEAAIRSGGLARQKSRRIRDLLREIERRHGALDLSHLYDLPLEDAMRELESFHGVGSKTAACVLMFGGGRDICPVDTHLHRVLRRLAVVPASASAPRTQELLNEMLPHRKAYPAHLNLIRFGRERCRAQNPQCLGCPLVRRCRWEGKGERLSALRVTAPTAPRGSPRGRQPSVHGHAT